MSVRRVGLRRRAFWLSPPAHDADGPAAHPRCGTARILRFAATLEALLRFLMGPHAQLVPLPRRC